MGVCRPLISHRIYRASFVLSAVLFVLLIMGGIIQSLQADLHLPDLNIEYQGHINVLLEQGDYERAIDQLRLAVKLDFITEWVPLNKLGNTLLALGDVSQAIAHYRQAIHVNPRYAEAHHNLGIAFGAADNLDMAIKHLRLAVVIDSNYVEAYNSLGLTLQAQGHADEAIRQFRQAVAILPRNAESNYNLGQALSAQGKTGDALDHFQDAITLRPDWPALLNIMAWTLATHSDAAVLDPGKAVRLAERASELSANSDPAILDTLAATYAAAGRFNRAVTTARSALSLLSEDEEHELATAIQTRIGLYQQQKTYRDAPHKSDTANH